MNIANDCLILLGGIAVFMLGLRFISIYTEKLSGGKMNSAMKKLTSNRFVACGLGATTTAIAQSSIATNVVAINFVNSGAISLVGACATVIGTNIGTTMTAQLVSLSFVGSFNVTAIGSLIAFLGFALGFNKNQFIQNIGNVALGFGLIFIGVEIISNGIDCFTKYEWFSNVFLVKSAPILLLNGFFITAICQSSSVVTSILVVLASKNMIGFTSAVYMIMGANVGTCIAVVISAHRKNLTSKRVAWFNVVFNVLGNICFIFGFVISNGVLMNALKSTSSTITRQIANFHTIFNLVFGLISLIFLNQIVALTEWLIKDKNAEDKKYDKNHLTIISKYHKNV